MEMNFEDAQLKRKYFKIAYMLMQLLSFFLGCLKKSTVILKVCWLDQQI